MNRRHALSLFVGAGLSSCEKKALGPRWRGVLFGIPAHLDFVGIDKERARGLGERAFAAVKHFESVCSLWEEGSELSRLNREGVLRKPSTDLLALLAKSEELYQKTGGLFDPTIHSYLTWLKKEYAEGRIPKVEEAQERRKLVDFSRVEISRGKIRIPHKVTLDFNALVQGAVTDRVADFLSSQVEFALVNFGEYRVVGRRSWQVEVAGVPLSIKRALAVSSGEGERLSATSNLNHLIHPKTGGSPEPKKIYAVEAGEAWLADGLATVVSLGGAVPASYPDVVAHEF